MKNFNGSLIGTDKRFVIVTARFNELITEKLTQGAKNTLLRHGVSEDNISFAHVPGAFELPLACQELANTEQFDGIIALGAVIRGGTPHFEYVCAEATRGIGEVNLKTGVPIGFGLLTTDTLDQALERSGSKGGNKGSEAAITTIEMVNLLGEIKNLN